MPVTFNYHFTIQQLHGENYFFGLASLFLYCTINQFFIHYVHHFLFLLGLVCENFFWIGWVIISSSSSVFLSLCASYLYPLILLIQLQFSDFVFGENKTVMAFWMLCHDWACLAVILESIAHFIIIILKSELSSLLLYSCFFYKLLNQDLNCFQCTILTFQKNDTLNFSWAEPNSN